MRLLFSELHNLHEFTLFLFLNLGSPLPVGGKNHSNRDVIPGDLEATQPIKKLRIETNCISLTHAVRLNGLGRSYTVGVFRSKTDFF